MPRALSFVGPFLAAALAGTAWWLADRQVDSEEVPAPRPSELPVEAPLPPAELRYEAPEHTRTPAPQDQPRMVKLPNGEYVPALNGAVNAPPMEWPADQPFSPIIGRYRTTELEWYVHADGTKSTTQMSYRTDLGRYDAVTTVARPTPPGQLPPGEPGGPPLGEARR